MSCSNENAMMETKKRTTTLPRPPPPPNLIACPVSFLVRGQSINNNIEIVMDADKIIEDACLRFSSLFTAIKDDSNIALLSLYNHCEPVLQTGPTYNSNLIIILTNYFLFSLLVAVWWP